MTHRYTPYEFADKLRELPCVNRVDVLNVFNATKMAGVKTAKIEVDCHERCLVTDDFTDKGLHDIRNQIHIFINE